MSSGAPAGGDALGASAEDQLKRWQEVEAEAWGTTTALAEPPPPPEPRPHTSSSNRPVVVVALLALVALGGLWFFTRPSSSEGVTPAKVVSEPVRRDTPSPCALLAEFRAVQNDSFVELLGEQDPSVRTELVAGRVRAELRLLDQLLEVEPSLTMSVAPIRFKAQMLADGIPAVEAGEVALPDLLASTESIDRQAAGGEQAVAAYEAANCDPG